MRDHGDTWARVTVGNTLLPRQKLGATAYAAVARDAQTADFATESETSGHATTADLASAVAANAVSSAGLQAGAVDRSKIGSGAVGLAQLDEEVAQAVGEIEGLAARVETLDSALSIDQGVLRLPNQPFVDWMFEVTLTTTTGTHRHENIDRDGRASRPSTGLPARRADPSPRGWCSASNLDDQCGFALTFHQNGQQIGGNIIMYQSLATGLDNLGATVSRVYAMSAGDTAHISARSGGACSVASVTLVGSLQVAFLH